MSLLFSIGSLFRIFEKLGFKNKFDYSYIYPTTHDAVIYIMRERKNSAVLISNMSFIHEAGSNDSQTEADRRKSADIPVVDQLNSIVNLDTIEPVYVDPEKTEYNAFREITDDVLKL